MTLYSKISWVCLGWTNDWRFWKKKSFWSEQNIRLLSEISWSPLLGMPHYFHLLTKFQPYIHLHSSLQEASVSSYICGLHVAGIKAWCPDPAYGVMKLSLVLPCPSSLIQALTQSDVLHSICPRPQQWPIPRSCRSATCNPRSLPISSLLCTGPWLKHTPS